MKQNILLIALTLVAGFANAEAPTARPVTRIDFNRMIDDNNQTRSDLKKNLDGDVATAEARKQKERSQVIDFVDVEVGVGETPKVVDRRFNSVGEAKLYSF